MLVTALPTPYVRGALDCRSVIRLVERQCKGGADGVLVAGTTGEGAMLSPTEKHRLVRLVKSVAPTMPIWIGIECIRTAAEDARMAEAWGAAGVLVSPPAFVKCTERGFVEYVRTIARAADLPVMLYNAPSRCGYALPETALDLLAGRVRYLKDAGTDLDYTERLATRFQVLCGNDALLAPMTERGAVGAVSVVSNVAPLLTRRLLEGVGSARDREVFDKLAKAMSLEVNPIPVKYLLCRLGIFATDEVRLPLTAAEPAPIDALTADIWEEIC